MTEQGPLSGQILGGKYLIGEMLGEGGFGMVYTGQHLLLDRPQAIKLLLERYFRRPKFRERFLREARMVAVLDHPHIVHIDDFGMEEQASRAYLVMPFIKGGTFHDVLKKRHRPLEVEQVMPYIEQIGSALEYAHHRGVVHLDLKPQNLLVHEDGRLLLADFGLAHLLKQEQIKGGTSLRYGTPHYMAPEHIRGQPEKQSDVYALGVILYQMLAGRRPFEGLTPEAVMMKHLTEPPPPLQTLRPELPLEMVMVVEKALAKQVAQRYQSASELVLAFKDTVLRAQELARRVEEERVRRVRQEELARKAEEERARKAHEEMLARKAEEERVRKVREEELARKVEEERVRSIHQEEPIRKAREEQPPSRLPDPASTGMPQNLRQRQFSWRKAGLIFILALLILGGAGGLFTTMHISTARTQAAVTTHIQTRTTARATTDAYTRFVAKNGIMFGFDAQHSDANPYEQILNPTTVGGLTKKWTYHTGDHSIRSSPAVVNGVVYVGSDDGNLYALDATSGTKKWTYHTGDFVDSSPAVVNGMVYVGSDDGNLYAFDATSGTKKWAYQTGYSIRSSPAVVNGVVYVGSDDGNLYAFDATSGTKKWAYQTGNFVGSSPAVAGGVVYIDSDDGNLYALDAASGTKKWAYHTGQSGSSPAVAGGVVYVGSDDYNLYALDAASGTKKWAYYHKGIFINSSPAVAGGVVYIDSDAYNVYALDAASGTKKWAYDTGQSDSSPAVINGVVYVSSLDGNLYAFHLPGR